MNLKTACSIAIFLSAGSLFIVFGGNFMLYLPMFKEAPPGAIFSYLADIAPYFILAFISITSGIVFYISLILYTRQARSATIGFIITIILVAISTLGQTNYTIYHLINNPSDTPLAIIYIAGGLISFASSIVLCLFILILLRNATGTIPLAVMSMCLTVLYFFALLGDSIYTFSLLYSAPLQITIFCGTCMPIFGDLLVMTVYIIHAKRLKSMQVQIEPSV